jgi:hypothetical protein
MQNSIRRAQSVCQRSTLEAALIQRDQAARGQKSNEALMRKIRGSSTWVGAGHVALNNVP